MSYAEFLDIIRFQKLTLKYPGLWPDKLEALFLKHFESEIQSFVERIYIVDENDERYCHIFIKGCTKEDYDEFFRATGYISGTRETGAITSKLPLCDSDECCKYDMVLASPLGMC